VRRTVNTLHLGYKKNQALNDVKGKVAVCSEIRTNTTQCEHHLEFLNAKPGGK